MPDTASNRASRATAGTAFPRVAPGSMGQGGLSASPEGQEPSEPFEIYPPLPREAGKSFRLESRTIRGGGARGAAGTGATAATATAAGTPVVAGGVKAGGRPGAGGLA